MASTYYLPDYPDNLADYSSPIGEREDFLTELLKSYLGESPATTPQGMNIQGILAGNPVMTEEAINANKKSAKRSFEHDQAAIRESFGRMGARFGTDLSGTLSKSAEDFRLGLAAQDANLRMTMANDASTRSLQALQTLLGTGEFTTGLEFTRGESAASRRLEELLQNLRNQGALDVAGLQAEAEFDIEFFKSFFPWLFE